MIECAKPQRDVICLEQPTTGNINLPIACPSKGYAGTPLTDRHLALSEALPVGGPVGVDMRQLRLMDSSGIQAIVAAANAPDACIVLHGVHGEVQKVVEMTGLDKIPNIHVIPCTSGV